MNKLLKIKQDILLHENIGYKELVEKRLNATLALYLEKLNNSYEGIIIKKLETIVKEINR